MNDGLNLYSPGIVIADNESILVQTLDPGIHTAIVAGAGGGTGIGLIEVYDVDTATDGQLANISTRAQVGTADSPLILGFILGPDTGGVTSVVVRALGPSLAASGVVNPLPDPILEIANSNGEIIQSNDDWASGPDAGTISADNLAPTKASESALLLSSGPGAYTAIVSGVGGTAGIGLVEIYNLE